MKKIAVMWTMILMFLNGYAAEIIRLTSGEWPPLISEKLKNYGFVSDIVKEAFALEGIKVEYGFFPWNRSLQMAKDGEWDGSVIWLKTEEREALFYFSKEPVYSPDYSFFYIKGGNFKWNNMDDLKKYRIGIVRGYSYGDEFDSYLKDEKLNTEEVADEEINLRKLLAGRIETTPINVDVGLSLIRSKFTPEEAKSISYDKKPLKLSGNYLILSKNIEKNKEMIKRFDRGMEKLKKSGKLEKILENAKKGYYDNLSY